MAYNHDISMANIVNVVEAFNRHSGMHSVDDLMYLIWIDASHAQIQRKINAPRNPELRTLEYARKQVRQEIRRTLYNHFNDVEGSPYDIYRATAYNDVERFWIAEPQEYTVEIVGDCSEVEIVVTPQIEDTAPAVNLIEALNAARDQINAEFRGQPNTPEVRGRLNNRIESIIAELGVSHV